MVLCREIFSFLAKSGFNCLNHGSYLQVIPINNTYYYMVWARYYSYQKVKFCTLLGF